MRCPTPISIIDKSDNNPQNKASKRLSVPCGKCGACRQRRRYEWAFRLQQELKDSENAHFITLTYADEIIPQHIDLTTGEVKTVLRKKDLQDFIKRLRENQYRKTGQRRFRYYAVGEYGTNTDRAHFHLIGFNIDRNTCNKIPSLWGYGHCHIGQVTDASILYVAKYHVNRNMDKNQDNPGVNIYKEFNKDLKKWEDIEELGERTKEFATMSKRPAIGYGYINRNQTWHRENMNNYIVHNGYKKALPRYYKDKLFDEIEKEQISNEMEQISDKQQEEQIQKLERLGFDQPDHELFKRGVYHAKKYKHKINDKNIF